jgi:hypothetical protein
MGHDPFGGQTMLSHGSHIRCHAYQIHNSRKIIVMNSNRHNCLVGGHYNVRNLIQGCSIWRVEKHCSKTSEKGEVVRKALGDGPKVLSPNFIKPRSIPSCHCRTKEVEVAKAGAWEGLGVPGKAAGRKMGLEVVRKETRRAGEDKDSSRAWCWKRGKKRCFLNNHCQLSFLIGQGQSLSLGLS